MIAFLFEWRLAENPSAIHLLEANQDKIRWDWLCKNPSAIRLLEANQDKIDKIGYWSLSSNPAIFVKC